MKTKADCIFCKIVAGTAPSAKVYEDDHTLAFMDLMPVSRGHTLVIPKSHSENLFEIEAPLLAAVADTSHRLAPAIRQAFEPDGLRIFQLNGAAAGANSLSLPHALVAEVRRPRRPLSRARHGRRGRTRGRRHGDQSRTRGPAIEIPDVPSPVDIMHAQGCTMGLYTSRSTTTSGTFPLFMETSS